MSNLFISPSGRYACLLNDIVSKQISFSVCLNKVGRGQNLLLLTDSSTCKLQKQSKPCLGKRIV